MLTHLQAMGHPPLSRRGGIFRLSCYRRTTVDQLENLVLAQLRDIRRELTAMMEHVQTSMQATHRVYERPEQFQDALDRLSGDIAAHRQDNRKSFLMLEADIVSPESQNISRHGELMNVTRDMKGLRALVNQEMAGS